MTVVMLFAKPGCHLCDDARPVVERVVAEFPGASLQEHNILDDPQLQLRYGEDIPVVMIDGRVHSNWRVDEARLRERLSVLAKNEGNQA